MEKIYDVDYFINKFEAIPEEDFAIGSWSWGDKKCTNGHCGVDNENVSLGTEEARALNKLFDKVELSPILITGFNYSGYWWYKTAAINDGQANEYQQPTPKQRILAALYDIKKLQQPEKPKVIHHYTVVKVSESIIEQATELINN